MNPPTRYIYITNLVGRQAVRIEMDPEPEEQRKVAQGTKEPVETSQQDLIGTGPSSYKTSRQDSCVTAVDFDH